MHQSNGGENDGFECRFGRVAGGRAGGHMEMRMVRMAKTLSMGTAHAVSDATILRNDSNLPAPRKYGSPAPCYFRFELPCSGFMVGKPLIWVKQTWVKEM